MLIKFIFTFLVVIFCFLSGNTQDTIRLKNGLVLHGLITEVNNKEIKFRVDGGSVTLDQVLSYQRNGNTVAVQQQISVVPNSKPDVQPDCERKGVGDMEFVNKTDNPVTIYIYAISTPPQEDFYGNDVNNPLVAKIVVPVKSSKKAYEIRAGVHYIKYQYTLINLLSPSSPLDGTGQIRITKCGTGTFELK